MQAINELAQNWWLWMSSMFWQVSLLILIIGVIDRLLYRWAWPQVRYALWLLVLLKLVLPPAWSSQVSLISHLQPHLKKLVPLQTAQQSAVIPGAPEQVEPATVRESIPEPAAPGGIPVDSSGRLAAGSAASIESGSPDRPALALSWRAWTMMIWILGMVFFIAILVGKMMRLRRWHQQQEERSIPPWFHQLLVKTSQRMNLNRLPAIVFNEKAVTPAVYGMFRPVLLLPAHYLDRLSREEAEHVLLHELAHMKRGDLWLNGIFLILQILYWFNPLIAWVRRQMKHVREICCDLTVAAVLREKTDSYRQTLLNTARALLTETVEPGLGFLGVFEEPYRLVSRLQWLEKKSWGNRTAVFASSAMVILLMTAFVLPMAALQPVAPAGSLERTSHSEINGYLTDDRAPSVTGPVTDLEALDLDITIRKRSPIYAVIMPQYGDPDHFELAIPRIRDEMARQKIEPAGPPFARFLSDPDEVPREKRIWEAGFPVKPGTKVRPPLDILQMAPMQVATLVVEGIKDTESLWNRFIDEIQEIGYVPAFPSADEFYTYGSSKETFWWRTEMHIQAFHPEMGYPGIRIEDRQEEPITALVLPMRGSFSQVAGAVERIWNYCMEKKLQTDGRVFASYYTDPTQTRHENLEWLVGIAVPEGTEAEPPYEIHDLGGGLFASAVVDGGPGPEYPWSPFVIQMVLQGRVPIGKPLEVWDMETIRSRPATEMMIPVMRVPIGADEILGGLGGSASAESSPEAYADDAKKWGKELASGLVKAFTGMELFPRVTFEQTEAFFALVLPLKGSHDQHKTARDKLRQYIADEGIETNGAPFGRYYNPPGRVAESELLWEVGVPINKSREVRPPFKVKKIPSEFVASAWIKTSFEEIEGAWERFIEETIDSGARPLTTAMEIWPGDPGYDGAAHGIQLRIQVEKTQKLLNKLENDEKNLLYVKEIFHTDRYSRGEKRDSKYDFSSELWLCGSKAAIKEQNHTFILDHDRSCVTFVNHGDHTYVETSLPFELADVLSDELSWMFSQRKTTGHVKRTRHTQRYHDRVCRRFDVVYWDLINEKRENQRDIKVWATEEFDRDLTLYHELLECMRQMYNRDDLLRSELAKIDGLQMRMEMGKLKRGSGTLIVSEVVEIAERPYSRPAFQVPPEYEQKGNLGRRDLGF